MNLSYTLLAITVTVAFTTKNGRLLWSGIILTIFVSIYAGVLIFVGTCYLISFTAICHYYFRSRLIVIRALLFTLILLFITGSALHSIPGFANTLAVPKTYLSPIPYPFVMYLNFDKTMAGLLL